MKIKTRPLPYSEVMKLPRREHKLPKKPGILFRSIVRAAAAGDLKAAGFEYTARGMEGLENTPCLILMNHSSFIDLEIVSKIFYPKPYCIVCTSDGFVGKPWLMRNIGCIPTQKFVRDVTLISDMEYALKTLSASVLMYPEASYSFDGRATPLPRKLGVLLKKLGVPVVGIKTSGAFARDPLYNCLQKRDVKVTAELSCLFRPEELKAKSVPELDAALDEFFSFDNFRWQQENRIEINEPFRADGLDRILYKCPVCSAEGQMEGKGSTIVCRACGKVHELDSFGLLRCEDGSPAFTHIPNWYDWERAEVRRELESGGYSLETDVDIGMLVDYKAIYMVGSGHLSHSADGFRLTGCDGELDYTQSPLSSYSLYSDYYWYELGDIICIGDNDKLFYCFPKNGTPVAKTRLAAEELYKLKKQRRSSVTV